MKNRLSEFVDFVSIPDRGLGFFRLDSIVAQDKLLLVSIPDRGLGFFRQTEFTPTQTGLISFNP